MKDVLMPKDCIYIASIHSWYHALGFLSYLEYKNIKPHTIVIMNSKFFGKSNGFNEGVFFRYSRNVSSVFSLHELNQKLIDQKCKKAIIASTSKYPYRISQILRSQGVSFEVLVLEEGIGTYGGFLQKTFSRLREYKAINGPIKGFFRFIMSSFLSELKKFFFLKNNYVAWTNYDIKKLTPNTDVIASYRKALSLIPEENSVSNLVGINALLVTSPFCELGMIDLDFYVDFLKKYFKDVENIYIKPHPIEDQDKYSQIGQIISPSIPLEMLLKSINSDVIIYSFSTTAAYTSKLFFDRKTIRIKEIDLFYDMLSSAQKKIIDISCD